MTRTLENMIYTPQDGWRPVAVTGHPVEYTWPNIQATALAYFNTIYQPLDADLTAIAGLGATGGFLTKTGANAWALDTTQYQPLDADLTAIAGLAGTSGALIKTGTNTWSLDTSSYQPLDADLTAIAALTGTAGLLHTNGAGTWSVDTTTYSASSHNHSGVYEPVISAGTTGQYWRGDKTWQTLPGTNLGYTAATRVLTSDTGTDVTLPLFSSTDPGLTPLSGGGTSNFLRADGTWAVPAGGAGTNLGYTAATRVLTSDTGTDVTLPLFSSTDPGLTPLSGGGTSNFLRADGTWAVPALGSSTMAQFDAACSDGNFVYQGQALGTPASGALTSCTGLPISTGVSGLGTGVATMLATPTMANFNTACSDGDFAYLGAANVFTTNQWLSGISPGVVFVETDQAVGSKNWLEVADGGIFQIQVRDDSNAYVSTALSLTRAGALTVSSVAGSGASLTSLNATNLSSGTVATARLGTGTADSTTFLRGDGTWAVPAGGAGTNLGYTASTRVLTSDTGTDVTLPLFSSTDPGLTPLSGGGTSNFLRADGTWAAPALGSSTMAQFDAACSDGDFAYVGTSNTWTAAQIYTANMYPSVTNTYQLGTISLSYSLVYSRTYSSDTTLSIYPAAAASPNGLQLSAGAASSGNTNGGVAILTGGAGAGTGIAGPVRINSPYLGTSGEVVIGGPGVATSDTTGRVWLHAHAGAPSGTPTVPSGTNYVALVGDLTNNKLHYYAAGWEAVASEAFVTSSYAPLASPALTGNPTAPTAAVSDADTSLATTEFVLKSHPQYILNADRAGSNATGNQSIFGVGVTLTEGWWEFEIFGQLVKTAGTTSHTIAFAPFSAGTIAAEMWNAIVDTRTALASDVAAPTDHIGVNGTGITAQVVTAAITTAAWGIAFRIRGTVQITGVNTATFNPQYSLSAAPGGAYSTKAGSFMRAKRMGDSGANVNIGSFA